MSFLNSVLSKIKGEEGEQTTLPLPPKVIKREPTTIERKSAASNLLENQQSNRKRKADDMLKDDQIKSIRPPPKAFPGGLGSTSRSQPDNGGAFRAVEERKEPPKGSFLEIMRRGAAAKNNPKSMQVGVVQHKKTIPKTAKEKAQDPRRLKNGLKQSKEKTKMKDGRTDSPMEGKLKSKTDKGQSITDSKKAANGRNLDTKKRQPTTPSIEYHGTARPKAPPIYTGTARPSQRPPGKGSHRPHEIRTKFGQSTSRNQNRRDAPSEEDSEEEEDEDEEDYESDMSSDMEATGADLEEEELLSSRLAKREDEEALREEMELKRQKELRKKKLASLAGRRP